MSLNIFFCMVMAIIIINCGEKPLESMSDLEEFVFSWHSLMVYYIFQPSLPQDPTVYKYPEDLYKSLNEPYTVYIPPYMVDEYVSYLTTGKEGAIGIFIDNSGDTFIVSHVVENSPARNAGLKKGDRLILANGKNLVGIPHDSLFNLLSGNIGEEIEIVVYRDSIYDTIAIVRGYVQFPTVFCDTLDTDVVHISLTQFLDSTTLSGGTAEELDNALLETVGFKATILDLRSNPGGLINQAFAVCDEFLDNGAVIIKSRFRDYDNVLNKGITKDVVYTATKIGTAYKRRLVVLVDKNTASAAEILTAGLKDNRADVVIMGSSTFGKARGQILLFTPINALAKITNMTFTTSKDFDYNEIGIEPHILLSDGDDWIAAAHQKALEIIGASSKRIALNKLYIKKIKNINLNRRLAIQNAKEVLPLSEIKR